VKKKTDVELDDNDNVREANGWSTKKRNAQRGGKQTLIAAILSRWWYDL